MYRSKYRQTIYSRKARINAGKIAWRLLYIPLYFLIKNFVEDPILSILLSGLAGEFVYQIVPIILKDLKIWR